MATDTSSAWFPSEIRLRFSVRGLSNVVIFHIWQPILKGFRVWLNGDIKIREEISYPTCSFYILIIMKNNLLEIIIDRFGNMAIKSVYYVRYILPKSNYHESSPERKKIIIHKIWPNNETTQNFRCDMRYSSHALCFFIEIRKFLNNIWGNSTSH